MTRRPAVTLIEVLVAIFVMGIGLMALLTLFPIGVLSMALAIQEERCAECAVIAHANAIARDVGSDSLVLKDPGPGGLDPSTPPNNVTDAFINPLPGTLTNAAKYAPSYPLLIDPVGYMASAQTQNWVGAQKGYLARRRVSYATTQATIGAAFTLWDDLGFDGTNPGAASTVAGSVVRNSRYSWAYLCQRPYSNDTSVITSSVVVFNDRPLALTQNLTLPEQIYPSSASSATCWFDTTNNVITIDYTNNIPPALRPGGWILDVTLDTHGTNILWPHGFFYRVVSATEFEQVVGGSTMHTYMQYEVETPLRGWDKTTATPQTINGQTFGYAGTAIVLEGVAEVFEKGPYRPGN